MAEKQTATSAADEISSDASQPVEKTPFNFSSLTAFSEDDADAAGEILQTFVLETMKNVNQMKKAIEEKNMEILCGIAHKMLPTFVMIDAKEAIPSLLWLESKRGETDFQEKAGEEARKVIDVAEKIIACGKDLEKRYR